MESMADKTTISELPHAALNFADTNKPKREKLLQTDSVSNEINPIQQISPNNVIKSDKMLETSDSDDNWIVLQSQLKKCEMLLQQKNNDIANLKNEVSFYAAYA